MSYFSSTEFISFDTEDIIDQIPTKSLQREIELRKEFENDNEANKRTDNLRIEIDLSTYNLIHEDDIELTDFDTSTIKEYLTDRGYIVLEGEREAKRQDVIDYFNECQTWRLKDLMCDILGLTHYASVDEILAEIKNKLGK